MGKIKTGKVREPFVVHQIVFAKVKGHREWPAQIIGTQGKDRYRIIFYGTNENGVVSYDALQPYNEETKRKFIKEHSWKRDEFQAAVFEAENDLEASTKWYELRLQRMQRKIIDTIENIKFYLALSTKIKSKMNFDESMTSSREKPLEESLLSLVVYFKAHLLGSVTRVMIFKYPKIAKTFIALQRFNPDKSVEQVSENVKMVNSVAEEICQQFKVLYDQQDTLCFRLVMNERETSIKSTLGSLKKTQLFSATTMDELEALVEAKILAEDSE